MIESRFPALDYNREAHEYLSESRHVMNERVIEPSIDEIEQFVAMPVRFGIHSMGPFFEIGPYSLTESDVASLHGALQSYIERFPEGFRRNDEATS